MAWVCPISSAFLKLSQEHVSALRNDFVKTYPDKTEVFEKCIKLTNFTYLTIRHLEEILKFVEKNLQLEIPKSSIKKKKKKLLTILNSIVFKDNKPACNIIIKFPISSNTSTTPSVNTKETDSRNEAMFSEAMSNLIKKNSFIQYKLVWEIACVNIDNHTNSTLMVNNISKELLSKLNKKKCHNPGSLKILCFVWSSLFQTFLTESKIFALAITRSMANMRSSNSGRYFADLSCLWPSENPLQLKLLECFNQIKNGLLMILLVESIEYDDIIKKIYVNNLVAQNYTVDSIIETSPSTSAKDDVVKKASIEQSISNIPERYLKFRNYFFIPKFSFKSLQSIFIENHLQNPKKKFGKNDDDLIIEDISVNFNCPLTLKKIIHPFKGLKCYHPQCFDLSSALQCLQEIEHLKCFCCHKRIPIDELFVDAQFLGYLEKYPDKMGCVIKLDGTVSEIAEGTVENVTIIRDDIGISVTDKKKTVFPTEIIDLETYSFDLPPRKKIKINNIVSADVSIFSDERTLIGRNLNADIIVID
ncbi:SUMO ligase siz1 [Clydaea vesicula]|uniref:SUMO ligase siz1 n=1 Tax=Clydaea vesicula TaxID=447962 RepID=A0AAD5TZG6_9FUNG|nr:SUMO ligase siz1 [Clydaea vesicula]